MKRNLIIISLVGLLAACVTINIYFPAAAAQEAADEIIDDVWQEEAASVTSTEAEPAETNESK